MNYRIAEDDEPRYVLAPTFSHDTARALRDVVRERLAQISKWGPQDHLPAWWLAILVEEVGEVAKELADSRVQAFDGDNYRTELVQVAAVAVAALEAFDRRA